MKILHSGCGRSNFRRFGSKGWATDTQIQSDSSTVHGGNNLSECRLKLISMINELYSSFSRYAEIVILNVINKPPSMWKKCKIQCGMGIENSQVCVMG